MRLVLSTLRLVLTALLAGPAWEQLHNDWDLMCVARRSDHICKRVRIVIAVAKITVRMRVVLTTFLLTTFYDY